MTKKEFLDVFNGIDDEFINEIIDIPEKNSEYISEESPENYFSDNKPQKIYFTKKRVPFWKIALSSTAAVFVLTAGIFAAVKFHSVPITPNDSTAADSSGVNLPNVSENSFPIINTIPKIKRVADEGYEFKFQLDGDRTEQNISVPARKNDIEDHAVFFVSCRGVSKDNPLRIMMYLTRDGETNVKRVCSFDITDEGKQYYTVPYEYHIEYGEECIFQVFSDGGAYIKGKWLP